jgi:acyl-CoA thioesterase
MPEALTLFSDASKIEPVGVGAFAADIPADWAQGRTAFGGLAAALQVNAVQTLPETAGLPVRSVDAAFIAPVVPGPVRVRAQVLRQGRNLTHAAAELLGPDDEAPLARVHVVLGQLRDSQVVVAPPEPPVIPIEDCIEMPYLPGITPDFTRNLDFRFASGFPFTGGSEARITGWCRHRSDVRGVASIAALVDAWPGTVLPLLTAPAPASTVRWSLQFPGDEEPRGDDWYWYTSDTPSAVGGYSTMTAQLWLDGRLLSWSEQLLAIFDRR